MSETESESDDNILEELNSDEEISDEELSGEEFSRSETSEEDCLENLKLKDSDKLSSTISLFNADLLKKIENTPDFNEFQETAAQLINEVGEIVAISKALTFFLNENNESVNKLMEKSVEVTGTSKLSGRANYTAYIFTTNMEILSKSYLFKALKKHIDEDTVEKIDKLQQTADRKGFVFDVPNEDNVIFKKDWKEGRFDKLSLLKGSIPELLEIENRKVHSGRGRGRFEGGRGRGGFEGGRGRGGFQSGRGRGGFEGGRGRGGFEGGRGRGVFEGGRGKAGSKDGRGRGNFGNENGRNGNRVKPSASAGPASKRFKKE